MLRNSQRFKYFAGSPYINYFNYIYNPTGKYLTPILYGQCTIAYGDPCRVGSTIFKVKTQQLHAMLTPYSICQLQYIKSFNFNYLKLDKCVMLISGRQHGPEIMPNL